MRIAVSRASFNCYVVINQAKEVFKMQVQKNLRARVAFLLSNVAPQPPESALSLFSVE